MIWTAPILAVFDNFWLDAERPKSGVFCLIYPFFKWYCHHLVTLFFCYDVNGSKQNFKKNPKKKTSNVKKITENEVRMKNYMPELQQKMYHSKLTLIRIPDVNYVQLQKLSTEHLSLLKVHSHNHILKVLVTSAYLN